ncbi:hypothetical protein Tco_1092238 [Tanacetum coccineum]|uniref:Uncharacterized protein n=1 Tax=Tanacetum coccineum TaxID=301880 RepID=A0ABQ5IAM9_9ASTR
MTSLHLAETRLLVFYMAGYRHSDKTSTGKDHRRCLLQISTLAQMGYFGRIHRLHELPADVADEIRALFRRLLNVGFINSEIEEMFMDGDGSSHKSSWYWTYSSIRFQPSSSVSKLKRKDLSNQVLETDPGAFDGFVGPLLESKDLISKERGAACWKEVIEEL